MSSFRNRLLTLLYALTAVYLTAVYFVYYPIPGVVLRVGESVLVLLFFWLAAALGRRALRAAGLAFETTLASFVFSEGLGLLIFSMVMLILGVAHGYQRAMLAAVSAVLAVFSFRDLKFWLDELVGFVTAGRQTRVGPASLLVGLIAAGSLTLTFLCSMAPPTYYDSLVYHLALPSVYLQNGAITFVPFNHYSHFPQNMELLFVWFLSLGTDVSAQMFCAGLGGLTVLTVWGMTSELVDAVAGGARRWAAVLLVTAPCFILLSSETYVETGTAFWTSLSVWLAWRAVKTGATRLFILSGLMGGAVAGIKYTGVLTPLLLCVMVLLWPRDRSWKKRTVDFLALGFSAFLVFLPWLIKNYVFTGGNPVFPFLPKIFEADRVFMHEESSAAYFHVLQEYKGTSPLLLELFKFPWRLITQPLSFGGGYDVMGDLGWAMPLLLFPLVFLRLMKSPAARFWTVYIVLHGILWVSMRPVLRFFFPVFPLICLLDGAALASVWSSGISWTRGLVLTGVILFTLSNAVLFYLVERVRDPFPAVLGLQTREEYLSKKLDYYPAVKFMNESLPPHSRVLFVGDQRGYYCRRPYLAPMALLPSPLPIWIEQSSRPEDLSVRLKEEGFTHLFYHRKEARRLAGYRVLELSPDGEKKWSAFLERQVPLYDTPDMTVYSLSSDSGSGSSR
ncbi:MAG TPA: glycosyltransferase family 39 protein [Elusimicrobiota bacterium]|nr:glycosyltransferase family 39 protein [Elusimicrobiota bacterium]